MKILHVQSLAIPDVKVIRFARFSDDRGYFCEHFRQSDVDTHPDLSCLAGVRFGQANESFSHAGVLRGLHFQWSPFMGKLVRCVSGHLLDLALDIRPGSPTCGQLIAYELRGHPALPHQDWIWLPPGFAHGVLFTEPSLIEYFCTGQWSPGSEASISPLSPDFGTQLFDPALLPVFAALTQSPTLKLSEKDRAGLSLSAWLADPRAQQFAHATCPRL